MTKDFVETVRNAGDIVRLISDYVLLKPGGSRLKGLCPFHQEKTPSFSVDPDQQLFYCFGCHAGGDVFKFVMLYEKVGFREATELLARRWGVPTPTGRSTDADPRQRVLELNEVAEAFYRSTLLDPERGRPARSYLDRRGITPETATRLSMGFAPDSWEALREHLVAKRVKPPEMVAAGLLQPAKDPSRRPYDRFRDRLIFPIRDATGRTVAFGGRLLAEGEPKYLNSPETAAYVKGDHLYGLDLSREAIRKAGFAIVVEGYLDLAAIAQAGFQNVVASLGTAFTPAQAQLLCRFTERVVVSYDGDPAGMSAAARSLDLLLERGLTVRVAELPEGLDPDDFLRKEGAPAYSRLVEQAPGYLDFLIHRESRSRDLSRIEEKVAALNAILPHIAKLRSPIDRASWAGVLADVLRIDDDLVLQELRSSLRSAKAGIRQRPESAEPPREAEARLVSLLLGLEQGRQRLRLQLQPGDLEGTRVARIVGGILRLEDEGGRVDYTNVLGSLESDADRDLLMRIAFRDEAEGRAEEVDDCLQALRRRRLKSEGRDLQRAIEQTDPAGVDDLLIQKMALARRIDSLS